MQHRRTRLTPRHRVALLRLAARLIRIKLHPNGNLVIHIARFATGTLVLRNVRDRWPRRRCLAVRATLVPEAIFSISIYLDTVRGAFIIWVRRVSKRIAVFVDGVVGGIGRECLEPHAAAIVECAADYLLSFEWFNGCFDAVGENGAAYSQCGQLLDKIAHQLRKH